MSCIDDDSIPAITIYLIIFGAKIFAIHRRVPGMGGTPPTRGFVIMTHSGIGGATAAEAQESHHDRHRYGLLLVLRTL